MIFLAVLPSLVFKVIKYLLVLNLNLVTPDLLYLIVSPAIKSDFTVGEPIFWSWLFWVFSLWLWDLDVLQELFCVSDFFWLWKLGGRRLPSFSLFQIYAFYKILFKLKIRACFFRNFKLKFKGLFWTFLGVWGWLRVAGDIGLGGGEEEEKVWAIGLLDFSG
jgi:hypothetical protein